LPPNLKEVEKKKKSCKKCRGRGSVGVGKKNGLMQEKESPRTKESKKITTFMNEWCPHLFFLEMMKGGEGQSYRRPS